MIDIIFQLSLLVMTVLTIAAIQMKDLIHAVILLAGAESVLAVVFFLMGAPDIAITQASVSAGLSTVIYVIAIHKTRRHEYE